MTIQEDGATSYAIILPGTVQIPIARRKVSIAFDPGFLELQRSTPMTR